MTVTNLGPARYVSISEAAEILDAKPWDVVRLIEDQRVVTIPMVDRQSLLRYREENAR